MPDAFESQDWVRAAVAASMLKSATSGSQDVLDLVANLLTSILPNHTKLEYKGLFTKKLVKASVTLGENVLTLSIDAHGSLVPTRLHTSRGIALKNEEWPMEDWTAALINALEEKAAKDVQSRTALARLLGQDVS